MSSLNVVVGCRAFLKGGVLAIELLTPAREYLRSGQPYRWSLEVECGGTREYCSRRIEIALIGTGAVGVERWRSLRASAAEQPAESRRLHH
ncbi:MAG: hypothetical protein M3Y93_10780 [Pseudomonadota bacterium]|nr:hypothetical protein [Pseudomonadota bacterium]